MKNDCMDQYFTHATFISENFILSSCVIVQSVMTKGSL